MKTIIELENISVIRGRKKILSNIGWTVEPGQHWALIGANGSGKTMLLKIITGYEWPCSGEVRVLGQTFGQVNICQLRKHIGLVSSAIEQKISVKDRAIDIVVSGIEGWLGLYRSFTKAEYRRADRVLKMLNAEVASNQLFETLSQGEQQKVLIARALINRPKLLILDEPCVGLDPGARRRLLSDIGAMAELKTAPTIILVTHHIEEIDGWISNVMLLKSGRMMSQGAPKAVLNSKNLTELFNFPCQLKHTAGKWRLEM